MKTSKKGPILLISILILVAVFIIGIRYGKQVEQTNKTINYILSITPTKATSPQPTGTITYLSLEHEGCGIEFLYPSNVTEKKISSDSAQLGIKGTEMININCARSLLTPNLDKVATESLTLQNKKITGYTRDNMVLFTFTNVKNNKKISIKIDKNLFPLFEKTLNTP